MTRKYFLDRGWIGQKCGGIAIRHRYVFIIDFNLFIHKPIFFRKLIRFFQITDETQMCFIQSKMVLIFMFTETAGKFGKVLLWEIGKSEKIKTSFIDRRGNFMLGSFLSDKISCS